ncbi:MAG: hypothetical protein ACD_15C00110G0007 [uncultured bacterium]|nr:MAG: hypothetical protein ACD_15C00110G0007 [uncultured bacterium]
MGETICCSLTTKIDEDGYEKQSALFLGSFNLFFESRTDQYLSLYRNGVPVDWKNNRYDSGFRGTFWFYSHRLSVCFNIWGF